MIGQQGVIAKEHPWLFAPREFFFGLVRVPQYAYDWGYSKAYLELLCVDTTVVKYPKIKKGGSGKGDKIEIEDRDAKAEEAIRIFKERQAQDKKNAKTIKLKE